MTPVAQLLLFRLALLRSARFHFFHSPTLYAFLHSRLGNPRDAPFPRGVRLLAVESSRISYATGEPYHLAVAILPEATIDAAQLVRLLETPREDPRLRGTPLDPQTPLIRATDLVAGTELRHGSIQPEWLTLAQVRAAAKKVEGARSLTLRFDSPLLILRTPVQRRDTFFDGESFEPNAFMDRVARAVREQLPSVERDLGVPTALPVARVVQNHLCRAETYYRGEGKVLPGAVGEVTLELAEELPIDWAVRLMVAGLIGVGKSTAMGQGRFQVQGALVHTRWPPQPATSLCERMAREDTLSRAREAMRHAGATPGVDDVVRDDFLESLTYRLPLLRDALATGSHRPAPLRGLLLQRADGRIRPLAVPTLDDRFLQRACVEELGPSMDELLEETSFAYRRGLSRRNAEHHVRKAHDDGYRHVLDTDLRAFFDRVDWAILQQRLSAYWGRDPAVELLMRWVLRARGIRRAPRATDRRLASGRRDVSDACQSLSRLFR